MHRKAVVHALLSDFSGSILLVRRKGGLLLGLPGGEVRPGLSAQEQLTSYCQRQVGVSPDFAAQLNEFTLAGEWILVGFAEVPHARAGARGRMEAAIWTLPSALPVAVDPVARMAVALRLRATLPALEAVLRQPAESALANVIQAGS